jgi:hypothetical protein
MTAFALLADLSADLPAEPFDDSEQSSVRSLTRRGYPWGTIAGVLLWAIGVVLELQLSVGRAGELLQAIGVAVVAFGAVGATADFVHNVPFLRTKSTSPWYVLIALWGGVFYACTKVAGVFVSSHAALWFHTIGTVGIVCSVTAWRLWLYALIQRSR